MFLIGIQAIGRLIEDQHLRIMENRLRQANPAFEPLGQGFDRLFRHPVQVQAIDSGSGFSPGFAALESPGPGDEFEKTPDRHFTVAGRAFRQVADDPPRGQRVIDDVVAVDGCGPCARRQESRQHFHGGGFTGAIRAEKTQDFSRPDFKTQMVYRHYAAKVFTQ